MAKIPAKVESRIKETLKRFKPVIEQAKALGLTPSPARFFKIKST